MSMIRILLLENDALDAELMTEMLKKDGVEFEAVLVDTREDFVAAIEGEAFDLILADYSLPAFDGLAALEIVRESLPDVPFILVSRTLGEEVAVESLKAGATDYVLKNNLDRLAPAVRRALREAEALADRRAGVAALRRSEDRYRQLFERNVAGVFRTTVDGRILDCNDAIARMFGYESREAAIAGGAPILYDDISERQAILDELRRTGFVTAWEHTMRVRDGRQVRVVESAALVEDTSGEPTIIEGSLIDITKLRALERELVRAQKLEAMGQLAGGIAHDFNNLLMSISGSAELLGFRFSESGTETQELATIRESVARGAELTRRLLAIARQQVLEIETLDLSAVVEDELKILRRLIPESIEIDLRLAEDLAAVRADRGQLGQILLNLILNARDAMPDGGVITVTTRSAIVDDNTALSQPGVRAGAHVCLSVEDTGAGMDAGILAHVFEPFFTTKLESEDTGMGLATVYGIVKQHGGFIEVESAPGEGARFEVLLPVAPGPIVEKDDSGGTEAVGGGETVLVVEDEEPVRMAVSGMLEALGYTVIEAANGEEALELLEGGTAVALVVTDVVMPKMGGRGLLESARKLTPRLAFLFSSGYSDETLRDLLKAKERTSFIAKPYTMKQLSRAVRQALGSKG